MNPEPDPHLYAMIALALTGEKTFVPSLLEALDPGRPR